MKNNAMVIGVRTRSIYGALAIMTIILSMGENTMAQTESTAIVKNIVLVHGGLVDGSGWEGVYNVLKKDGYTVTIVQNPTSLWQTTWRLPSGRSPLRTAP
jgi:triacylglycerol esterase/lipase EstA (alpha/beta hydrolase family)